MCLNEAKLANLAETNFNRGPFGFGQLRVGKFGLPVGGDVPLNGQNRECTVNRRDPKLPTRSSGGWATRDESDWHCHALNIA